VWQKVWQFYHFAVGFGWLEASRLEKIEKLSVALVDQLTGNHCDLTQHPIVTFLVAQAVAVASRLVLKLSPRVICAPGMMATASRLVV